MKIQQQDYEKEGFFFIEEGNKQVAVMTYKWASASKITIDHTGVDSTLEGRGIGKQLVEHAVAFARRHRLKIVPVCPFAKHVLDSSPALQDVL